jgi:uncharacterized membrane protein YidH (DUF202 family)
LSDSAATGARPVNTLTAERTVLAWTRTSFAFLANGALLAVKNLHGSEIPARLIPALLAAVVALGAYAIAVHRQRVLQQHPIPKRLTPRPQVYTVGIGALVLIVVTALAQLI